MRAFFVLIATLTPIAGIIFHIWTAIIGFQEGGFVGGILTLIFPVIAEIYWVFKMFGENTAYTTLIIIYMILFIPTYFVIRAEHSRF